MVSNDRLVKRFKMLVRPALASLLAASVIGMSTATAQQIDDSRGVETQVEEAVELNLASGFFATPISIQEKGLASITSIRLTAKLTSDQGAGMLELNRTALKFNDFGDIEVNGSHQSESIPIQFRKVVVNKDKEAGNSGATDKPERTLYKLTLKDGSSNLNLVVPKLESETCRLIIREGDETWNVLLLSRVCLVEGEAKARKTKIDDSMPVSIDLFSDYLRTEIGFKQFRIQGTLGAKGSFYLNPNQVHLNGWGEVGMSTLLGWFPKSVELRLRNVIDPLGQGRKQFEIVGNEPRQTQYILVFSPAESQHRLVIKSEDTVIYVAPLLATEIDGSWPNAEAELPFTTK